MEVVQVFNNELQSLSDSKPPVSKAKMGLITRAAMKGVKYYKFIVHSVEKFIDKCRPEYKVPGLYVIDSIVRQSRHQFGIEKDVYAARFSRNLQTTFSNLFSGCILNDKPKIVRVLNLWQKNGVFDSQVIQPLLDMANPNSSVTIPVESNLSSAESPNYQQPVKQAQSSKYSHHFATLNSNSHPNSTSKQSRPSDSGLRFSKDMLDFDYGEEDDDDADETPTEAEPPLSSTLNKIEMEHRSRNNLAATVQQPSQQQHYEHARMHPAMLPNQMNPTQTDQDPVLERWNKLMKQQSVSNETPNDSSPYIEPKVTQRRSRSRSPHQTSSGRDRHGSTRDQTSSREASSIKSIAPVTTSSTTKRADLRREERDKKCLPEIRDKHLTVCSSTLWLGHVPKTVSEADISDAFGEFGSITSINLIPPRGCAYVCMDRRQDAKRALKKSKDLKLNGNHIKMAWAPGKGFKEYKKLKEYWEVDIGTSYIPYNKIDESIDFDVLEEGGVIDEDSMSMEMRERRERKIRETENKAKGIKPHMNLPIPALPILSQPPPFTIRPNMNIPPPTALSQSSGLGVIPFPPPTVSAAMPMANQLNSQSLPDGGRAEQSHTSDRSRDVEQLRSPNAIDQQISMTERQINMVEQQLSLIQQAQGMNQAQPSIPPHMTTIYHQNQPNPIIFDLPPPQMLHNPQLMDPLQVPMFPGSQALIGQNQQGPAPMLPISQANINPNGINANLLPPPYGGGGGNSRY